MTDTIRIQIRWPKPLVAEMQRIAAQRHTTFSELVRQAVIDEYSLASIDVNPVNHDAKNNNGGSLS